MVDLDQFGLDMGILEEEELQHLLSKYISDILQLLLATILCQLTIIMTQFTNRLQFIVT